MIFTNQKKIFFIKTAKAIKNAKFKEKKELLKDLEKELLVAKTILEHMKKQNKDILVESYEEKIKEIKEKINKSILKDL
ncbi:MAG: hypothetical protein ACMXX6_01020 [Candidatus Woesearchaeota archaeon]